MKFPEAKKVAVSTNWKIRFNKRAGSRPGSKKPSAVEVTKSKLDQPQSCCSTTTQNIFKPMCQGGCLAKLSLPFAEKREFVNVGDTILHVLPCTTAWDDESVAGDSCTVCKDERKEIIADLNKKVHRRLYGGPETEDEAQGDTTVQSTNLEKSQRRGSPKSKKEKKQSKKSGKREEKRSGDDKKELESQHVGSKKEVNSPRIPVSQEMSGTILGRPTLHFDTARRQHSETDSEHGKGTMSKSARSVSSLRHAGLFSGANDCHQNSISQSSRVMSRHKMSDPKHLMMPGNLKKPPTTRRHSLTSEASRESVNSRMTYAEWDKIKDQTLAALYDQNPDIEKLFSMYIQVRKVRMSSSEMSNVCNEAQALLDNTVAQLYTTMTETCRENVKLNKMQETDMNSLMSLITASQLLKQQLHQFNIFDRDGIVKRSEAKIRERLKKSITIFTKTKDKDNLMELILLMKNNAVLRCGDLLEIARRQVQGITYDDFISKHSIRLGNNGKVSKTRNAKQEYELREGLSKLVNDIGDIEEESERDIDSSIIIKLIQLLEQNLKGVSSVSQYLQDGIELYFKIIRAAIRRTVQTKEGGESVRRLRNLMRGTGRSLPLRLETLEILQLTDKFTIEVAKIEALKSKNSAGDIRDSLKPLQQHAEKIIAIIQSPDVKKVIPKKLEVTVKSIVKKMAAGAWMSSS